MDTDVSAGKPARHHHIGRLVYPPCQERQIPSPEPQNPRRVPKKEAAGSGTGAQNDTKGIRCSSPSMQWQLSSVAYSKQASCERAPGRGHMEPH